MGKVVVALLLVGCLGQSHGASRGEEHQTLTAFAALLLASFDLEVAWQTIGSSASLSRTSQVYGKPVAGNSNNILRSPVRYADIPMQLDNGLGQMTRRSILGTALAAAAAASLPEAATAVATVGRDGSGDIYNGFYKDMRGAEWRLELSTSPEEGRENGGIRLGQVVGGKNNETLPVKANRETKIQIDFGGWPIGKGKEYAKLVLTDDGVTGLLFEDQKTFWLKDDDLDRDFTMEEYRAEQDAKQAAIAAKAAKTSQKLKYMSGNLDQEVVDIVENRKRGIGLTKLQLETGNPLAK